MAADVEGCVVPLPRAQFAPHRGLAPSAEAAAFDAQRMFLGETKPGASCVR